MSDHNGLDCEEVGLIGTLSDELAEAEREQERILKELQPGDEDEKQ